MILVSFVFLYSSIYLFYYNAEEEENLLSLLVSNSKLANILDIINQLIELKKIVKNENQKMEMKQIKNENEQNFLSS